MKRILVLSSAESPYTLAANRVFVEQIQKRIDGAAELVSAHYSDLLFELSQDGVKVTIITTGETLTQFDLIYVKSYYRYSEMAQVVIDGAKQAGVQYLCHELDDAISFTKLSQYSRMALHHLPIGRTLFTVTSSINRVVRQIQDTIGYPCVMKAIDGKGGDLNFLIQSEEDLCQKAVEYHDTLFVVQQFIANEYDLRVLVAGNNIQLVIKRQRVNESTHLNNTSQGATATLLDPGELSNDASRLSLRAAALFKRDIAGVDLMFESGTGDPYILEVNASPQVATGAFMDEKLDVYAQLFCKLLDIDK